MPTRAMPNLDLKRERFRQQMSRTELARHTNISRKSLLEIEERRSRVRMHNAARIAKALQVEIEDVFQPDEVIG